MTVLAIESQYARLSALVKMSDTPEKFEFHTDLVTAHEAATPTYTLGTVLGKITATGKYIVSVQTAVDGSQVPAAIYIGNSFGSINDVTLVAATDTTVLAITRGKIMVSAQALKLDASFTAGALTTGAYASLAVQGILVQQSN